MSRIKAVFFDAAGTLFHVRGSVADVYLAHAEDFGVKRTPDMVRAVNEAFARAFKDAPPAIFAVTDPAELKQCERLWWFDIVHNVFYRVGMFERFDDYFDQVYEAFAGPQHWSLYPDTLAAVKRLKDEGYELGIISNFDTRLFSVLQGLGLSGLFDTVTISSLARAAKPSARIFHFAMEQHAVEGEEAVHVGDSLRDDVDGARSAGLTAYLIDRERPDPAAAEQAGVITSLDRLPGLLASL